MPAASDPVSGTVTVRYWAGLRAAAGVAGDEVPGGTLAEVLDAARALHSAQPRFASVLAVCSVLVGDRPVGAADPATLRVVPGETVELLPPFAGG